MPSGELSIPVRLHQSELWVGIVVRVGPIFDMLMVLDSGAPVSAIAPRMHHELRARGLLGTAPDPRYHELTELTAKDAPHIDLPDLRVRVLPRLALLRIDGLLGLDFFRRFDRVCFHIATARLVLEYPPASA